MGNSVTFPDEAERLGLTHYPHERSELDELDLCCDHLASHFVAEAIDMAGRSRAPSQLKDAVEATTYLAGAIALERAAADLRRRIDVLLSPQS